ncbi:MAG: hypothetical protein HY744_30620 [Deltaproteobacteria bacterium]|nr:hypothetical protein [Deltaproteobacteria bacterium]
MSAHTVEQVEKRRWRDQYRRDYGSLTALYPDDRRKVETYFKRPPKRDRDEGEPKP